MPGNKLFYWDSNVYLAWLKEEAWRPEFSCLEAMADAVFEKKISIVTSVLTLTEVFENELDIDKQKLFSNCFNGYNHKIVEVTPAIARLARDYRQRFRAPGPRLLTPDAIHLATAHLENVEVVHTFDDGKKPGYDDDHEKVKTVSLLSLNGKTEVDGLIITKPDYPVTKKALPASTLVQGPLVTGEEWETFWERDLNLDPEPPPPRG